MCHHRRHQAPPPPPQETLIRQSSTGPGVSRGAAQMAPKTKERHKEVTREEKMLPGKLSLASFPTPGRVRGVKVQ